MVTGRAVAFIITALILYVFGNQTQVGWLYVMSALIGGLVVVGWMLSRSALRGIQGERAFDSDECYEGDTLDLELRLKRRSGFSAYQVALTEICPLAAPDQRENKLFAPVISTQTPLVFAYSVIADRRGIYHFPLLTMRSGFPFGFFRRRGSLNIATDILIYPEVRPITRFPLLDRKLAAQRTTNRAGYGGEVIGVRPFRSGDLPRHVHWRSTARTGQLMSKEFADEQQPTLMLILDTRFDGDTSSKHNPFEWAVKCAVSVVDYANRRHIPFTLSQGDPHVPTSSTTLTWDAFLQVMARVQPASTPFDELLHAGHGTLIVAVIPQPNIDHFIPLAAAHARGASLTVILLDNASFGIGDSRAADLHERLRTASIDCLIVRQSHDYADSFITSIPSNMAAYEPV